MNEVYETLAKQLTTRDVKADPYRNVMYDLDPFLICKCDVCDVCRYAGLCVVVQVPCH